MLPEKMNQSPIQRPGLNQMFSHGGLKPAGTLNGSLKSQSKRDESLSKWMRRGRSTAARTAVIPPLHTPPHAALMSSNPVFSPYHSIYTVNNDRTCHVRLNSNIKYTNHPKKSVQNTGIIGCCTLQLRALDLTTTCPPLRDNFAIFWWSSF